MTVYYQWDVEEIANEQLTSFGQEFDKDDVMEHYHQTSFKDCQVFIKGICWETDNTRLQIVLVRDDDESRSWAYMEGNKLPEFFINAYGNETTKVPKRFHKEVEKNSK